MDRLSVCEGRLLKESVGAPSENSIYTKWTIQNFIEESSSLGPRATLNIVPVAPLFIKTRCLWTDNVGRGTCCYVTVGNDN